MPTFAVNLSMLFTEAPLQERFDLAAQAGFKHVEIQFPYELPIETIQEALKRNGQTLELINFPAGDWAAGERGIACNPDRTDEFRQGVALALEYASALGVKRINALSGIQPDGVSDQDAEETFAQNLRYAAQQCEGQGIQLLAEAINTQDIPGFFLNRSEQLFTLKERYQIDALQLQYDVYHMQIMEGNLITTLQQNLGNIGHIQIADVPGRHEPGTGEINFPNVLSALDEMGYPGVVSLEYIPANDTLSGLTQLKHIIGGQ